MERNNFNPSSKISSNVDINHSVFGIFAVQDSSSTYSLLLFDRPVCLHFSIFKRNIFNTYVGRSSMLNMLFAVLCCAVLCLLFGSS
ncbi:hypothetical protein T4C_12276 [Trichinella pseudospiralis]|uniref:Uncharacterized protein n=1 Tax=Trichinella pseudospiralis TaxID=6337 RepID=A0A0V1K8Q8_TRIPS|nr:hypothetical protein T4C_12276 [Trichinella pseudospiralis]